MVIFGHSVLQTYFMTALGALVCIEFSQLSFAFNALTHQSFLDICHIISLAIHCFMNAKILFNAKVIIHINGFVAKWAYVYFFVLFFVLTATVRFNWWMVSTVKLFAVLTFHGKPIFLATGIKGTEFSYILIEHFE